MFVALVVVSTLLALLLFGSAMGKFRDLPPVRQLIDHVGMGRYFRLLGWIELTGAIGLVVGLFVAPIGVAAAAGIILYMAGAMIAHLRVHDGAQQVLAPLVPLLFAVAALVLRLATA